MKHIILSISFLLMILSCESKQKNKIYRTTNKSGYCYHDGGYWYIYYYNPNTGLYNYYGSTSSFSSYDNSSAVNWSSTPQNTENFSQAPQEVISDMQESVGEEVTDSPEESSNSSESDNSGNSGMSESSGDSAGGSDGGGE